MRLSAFRRSVKNLISWADTDGDFVYRPENVAEATVSGWEAQVLYRPSASISIPVGYQQLSTQDDETHDSLPGAVHSLWRAAIQGTGTSFTWSLEYAATDRGEYPAARRDPGAHRHQCGCRLAGQDRFRPGAGQPAGGESPGPDYETVEGYPMRGRSWFAEVKVGW